MDFLIVTASGPVVGAGHGYRAEALAEVLRESGDAVTVTDLGRFEGAPPTAADIIVTDLPDRHLQPAVSGCVQVTEVGDVLFPDGERLEGLRYAMLRPGFRAARPVEPVAWNPRVLVHHAAKALPLSRELEVVQLSDHPRPWEMAATCCRTISYPSMTALEGACLGHALTLLGPRNAGELQMLGRLDDAARRPGLFDAVDGLGAWRVAEALRAYAKRRSSTRK